jgi:hypothetical protein
MIFKVFIEQKLKWTIVPLMTWVRIRIPTQKAMFIFTSISVLPILKLVQSLIVPLFLYCDEVYSQSSVGVNSMLNVAFNSCARYIYGIPRGASISAFSRRILGVPLNVYFNLRKASMIWLLCTGVPDYLSDRLRKPK